MSYDPDGLVRRGPERSKVQGGVSVNVTLSGADVWGPGRLVKDVQSAIYTAVTDSEISTQHAVAVNVSIEVE